jgi:hypothetical protein
MISPRKLLSAVAKFAISVSTVGVTLFVAFDGMTVDSFVRSAGLLGFAGIAGVGYGLALWVARRHLRADAQVGGRRDLIAGILAIVLILAASTVTQGAAVALRFTIILLSGTLSAVLMYFPWFQRQPEDVEVEAVQSH